MTSQARDFLEGVNISRLMSALTRMGCAHDSSQEHVVAALADHVNQLTRAVESMRASDSSEPALLVSPDGVGQESIEGDVLPPIGSRVYIRHGRDDDAHACTVTGYYAWADLGGNKRLHRVFVRLVYEGTEREQARMLCDCYPTREDALAAVDRKVSWDQYSKSSPTGMRSKRRSPYGWVRETSNLNSGVFHLGSECPPGWFGATPVFKDSLI